MSSAPTPSPPPGPPSLLSRPGPPPKIDTIYDFSNRGLGELKAWIETWFIPERAAMTSPAGALSGPQAARVAQQPYWAGATGVVSSGGGSETILPHPLGAAPLAVASPASGSTQGVYVTGVTSDEEKVVVSWSQPNVPVAANVIAVVP